jgi:hypothetical protein
MNTYILLSDINAVRKDGDPDKFASWYSCGACVKLSIHVQSIKIHSFALSYRALEARTRERQNEVSFDLVLRSFAENCRDISVSVKIEQK